MNTKVFILSPFKMCKIFVRKSILMIRHRILTCNCKPFCIVYHFRVKQKKTIHVVQNFRFTVNEKVLSFERFNKKIYSITLTKSFVKRGILSRDF